MVAGDFNGDKNLDLAICNLESPLVSLFLGNGDGTFQPHVDFGSASDGNTESIVAADFNGDGKLDLAVGDGQASIFLGNGDGTFRSQVDIQEEGLLGTVAVGDFNNDGIPDLIGGYQGSMPVLLGNGDGTFREGNIYVWPVAFVAAADLNHDGKLDLIGTGGSLYAESGVFGVFVGNGDGTFQANRSFALPVAGGSGGATNVVADFNGDGILDVASTNAIMLGNGDGTFQPYSYFMTGNVGFADVATADFNGDGKPDLAVTTLDFSNQIYAVNVLLGKGDGTFRPPITYDLSDVGSVTAADLNGDHIPDLVVGIPDGFVDVLLGRGDGTFLPAVEYPVALRGGEQ